MNGKNRELHFNCGPVATKIDKLPEQRAERPAEVLVEQRVERPAEQTLPCPVCKECLACPPCKECPACQQTAIVGDLILNQQNRYTVRGQNLVVELVANDGKTAKFIVNGEVSEALAVGNGDVFKNNVWLMPTAIDSGGAQFVIGSPTFYSSAR